MFNPVELDQFTGTENWWKHALSGYIYTDGVKYVAETFKAFWLLDEIMFATKFEKNPTTKAKMERFGAWTLKVENESAVLTCTDGNDNELLRKEIEYTDFPHPICTMWMEGGVLILPSEH